MATVASHNTSNASIKRILKEARQIQEDPSEEFVAAPLEDNLFDWHCTLRGPKDTEFEGGLYHVRITLPPTYPFRPPSLRVLTPSGRFETDTPVCISFTNYHEELWQPAWGIRTAIIGLQGFFPQSGTHAIGVGALNAPIPERRRLAHLSREWKCPHCKQRNIDLLSDPMPSTSTSTEPSDATAIPLPASPQPISTSVPTSPPPTAMITQPPPPTPLSDRANIVLPSFPSVPANIPTEEHTSPMALNRAPFFELGPKPEAAESPTRPNTDVQTDGAQGQQVVVGVQPGVQAFPVFRSNAEGIPLWLDSAILILSVLLGGIIAHRVMF